MTATSKQDTTESLRATHWHKCDAEAWGNIIEAIPSVIETELKLWALRVDRKAPTDHLPHKQLFTISATHYVTATDVMGRSVSAPDGQELVFMVAAESRREACDTVKAQLDAHGLNGSEWSMGSRSTPLILIA